MGEKDGNGVLTEEYLVGRLGMEARKEKGGDMVVIGRMGIGEGMVGK